MDAKTRNLVALLARPTSNKVITDLHRRRRRATVEQVARKTRVSSSSVASVLDALSARGLASYAERKRKEAGRPRRSWKLEKEGELSDFEKAAKRLAN